jgi:hypothetical protein
MPGTCECTVWQTAVWSYLAYGYEAVGQEGASMELLGTMGGPEKAEGEAQVDESEGGGWRRSPSKPSGSVSPRLPAPKCLLCCGSFWQAPAVCCGAVLPRWPFDLGRRADGYGGSGQSHASVAAVVDRRARRWDERTDGRTDRQTD